MKTDSYRRIYRNRNRGSLRRRASGFTLVELLVVMVIAAILASIILPSFISQASRAREVEAQTYVSALSRGQSMYYIENGSFATDLTLLPLSIPQQTNNYDYFTTSRGAGTDEVAISVAQPRLSNLRPFSSITYLELAGGAGNYATTYRLCPGTDAPTRDCGQ